MTQALARLLPLHELREGRAQRACRERIQACTAAVAAERAAASELSGLQHEQACAFSAVLDGSGMHAADACGWLTIASGFDHRIETAAAACEQLAESAALAQKLAEEARLAYAAAVRASRKVGLASTHQRHAAQRARAARAEQEADEEHVQRNGLASRVARVAPASQRAEVQSP